MNIMLSDAMAMRTKHPAAMQPPASAPPAASEPAFWPSDPIAYKSADNAGYDNNPNPHICIDVKFDIVCCT